MPDVGLWTWKLKKKRKIRVYFNDNVWNLMTYYLWNMREFSCLLSRSKFGCSYSFISHQRHINGQKGRRWWKKLGNSAQMRLPMQIARVFEKRRTLSPLSRVPRVKRNNVGKRTRELCVSELPRKVSTLAGKNYAAVTCGTRKLASTRERNKKVPGPTCLKHVASPGLCIRETFTNEQRVSPVSTRGICCSVPPLANLRAKFSRIYDFYEYGKFNVSLVR